MLREYLAVGDISEDQSEIYGIYSRIFSRFQQSPDHQELSDRLTSGSLESAYEILLDQEWTELHNHHCSQLWDYVRLRGLSMEHAELAFGNIRQRLISEENLLVSLADVDQIRKCVYVQELYDREKAKDYIEQWIKYNKMWGVAEDAN